MVIIEEEEKREQPKQIVNPIVNSNNAPLPEDKSLGIGNIHLKTSSNSSKPIPNPVLSNKSSLNQNKQALEPIIKPTSEENKEDNEDKKDINKQDDKELMKQFPLGSIFNPDPLDKFKPKDIPKPLRRKEDIDNLPLMFKDEEERKLLREQRKINKLRAKIKQEMLAKKKPKLFQEKLKDKKRPYINFERFEEYLINREDKISELTRKHYLYRFNKFMKVRNKYSDLEDEQDIVNKFQRKYKLTNQRLSKLNPLNKYFLEHFYNCFIEVNKPEKIFEAGKTSLDEKIKFISILEVKKLYKYLSFPLNLFVYILFLTGLRRFELVNILTNEINFEENKIFCKGKGKKGKNITVNLPKNITKQLYEWCKICPVKDKPFHLKENLLYPSAHLWRELSIESERILGYKVTPHQMRHSLAVYLRKDKKVDLEIIRKVLRHESLESTGVYVRATDSEVKDTMKDVFKGLEENGRKENKETERKES